MKLLDCPNDQLDGMLGEAPIDRSGEAATIGLDPRSAHRAALAGVEHAAMNRCLVCRAGHNPAERVDLAHQMALADAADRRIARHAADVAAPEGDQRHTGAAARGGRGCFHAGVTGPDD